MKYLLILVILYLGLVLYYNANPEPIVETLIEDTPLDTPKILIKRQYRIHSSESLKENREEYLLIGGKRYRTRRLGDGTIKLIQIH